jgi:hypothetical protein
LPPPFDGNVGFNVVYGPLTAEEKLALLDYCETDVIALKKLLHVMAPHIDLPRALLRGRYMKAAANIEWTGSGSKMHQVMI